MWVSSAPPASSSSTFRAPATHRVILQGGIGQYVAKTSLVELKNSTSMEQRIKKVWIELQGSMNKPPPAWGAPINPTARLQNESARRAAVAKTAPVRVFTTVKVLSTDHRIAVDEVERDRPENHHEHRWHNEHDQRKQQLCRSICPRPLGRLKALGA